jgi:hypothetical protein
LVLWAAFAVSLFIVFGSITSDASGAVHSSFFRRLADQSAESKVPFAELAADGVLRLGMAILVAWVAHVLVLVGLDILAGKNGVRTADARTIDGCAAHLYATGWSVGDTWFMTDAGIVWQVDGSNGENRLLARAPTQAGAWRLSCEQAASFALPSGNET